MLIADIQTQLTALGVSLIRPHGWDPVPDRPVLQSQRQYRAAFYLNLLQAAAKFLNTDLRSTGTGLGDGYAFVEKALADSGLLNELAVDLDTWLTPAVVNALREAVAGGGGPGTYEEWFENGILKEGDTYRTSFLAGNTLTANALTKISANFQANIELACTRIIADRPLITKLFEDRYPGTTLVLRELTRIETTGSDFHKGGQQVLILTFATNAGTDLKVVYKPADLEVDCLITGDAAAVNRATGTTFMEQSLLEIFNARAAKEGALPLPTYRILPRNRTSTSTARPVPIRLAYGYVEFLGYDVLPWWTAHAYPSGPLENVISAAEFAAQFYRQAGHLAAVASTFSITDLHAENVLASNRQPHLIDLEVSLTAAIGNVRDTSLFSGSPDQPLGGIDGNQISRPGPATIEFRLGNPTRVATPGKMVQQVHNNRLRWEGPIQRAVKVDAAAVLLGFREGMQVLAAIATDGGFRSWLQRCQNVLVRILPLSTHTWNTIRDRLYDAATRDAGTRGAVPATVAQDALREELFAELQKPPTDEPDFVGLAGAQAATDLLNFDIPAFYHRIGTVDLLDSAGVVVPVPTAVTVLSPDGTATVPTRVGRATFFAAPPTAARVTNGQVAELTGDLLQNRIDTLLGQMRNRLVDMKAIGVTV